MTSAPHAPHRRTALPGLVAAVLTTAALASCTGHVARKAAPAAAVAPAVRPARAHAPAPALCGKPPVTLEPQAQAFLNQLAAADEPPLYTLSYAAARKVLDNLQAQPIAKLPADISDRTVPGGPTGPVSIRVVRPAGVKGTLPGVVYLHGGGWVLGNAKTHDRLVRQIANGARAAVVFVNYTPSPEAQFPVPLEQSYTVAKWLARHGRQIGVDPTRLAIAGDSVGGDMTAAVTLLAKQRGGPHFKQQVLLYPVTDARFDTASYRRFADGCWLTRKAMMWFWDAYAPKVADRKNPLAAPLRARVDQLRGLPPALLITDSDVLLDEGNAYAAKLRAAGVPVTTTHYGGITHDFMMLDALAGTRSDREAVAEVGSVLHDALYGADPAGGRGK
ncbi:alpha/beta hydrolase [Peterkaempfera bronchialis]|uniref:Alpha/beta hydrolase n=1 Tax=Peterkaempfera bronchialis TaxID=2126346 RepID=A0A345T2X1_9ACTN|nr:alpha/beta hydrolase [Peterkaempfera bronchialis]AXI80326.1 alpha/beta hydrolase [Peterkaempfera bronchialis]